MTAGRTPGVTAGPGAAPPTPLRERTGNVAALRRLARDGQLYAVVDAAGKPDVYAALVAAGSEAASLYAGAAAEQYAGVAPWLLAVTPARLDWVGRTLGGDEGWGLFVIARHTMEAVRRQLRRLLTVRLPDGRLVRFRFYDPRVLPPFLGACTEEELRFVFGPLGAFATVAPVTRQVRVWDRAAHPAILPRPTMRLLSRLAPPAPPAVPATPAVHAGAREG